MLEEFEEDTNAIVDCDILEAAKENIQPLAGGRRATALASVLATPHGHRDARLIATKARLRERVREAQERVDALTSSKENDSEGEHSEEEDNQDEDEDALTLEEAEEILLDAYVRLVTWTVEHYPRGQSVESGILELLEEATRVMRHSEFAKADPRYLNLWIRYATYIDKPEIIFEFLLVNEIGTAWAKLYEEYAAVLEKSNRRTKADDTYLLGIARKAEPLDHLERRHRDFQKRMMVSAPVQESGLPVAPTAPASAVPRRRILGESTSSSSTASSLTSASTSQRSALASVSSHDDVFSAPSSSSIQSLGTRRNGRMQVFVDPTGEDAGAAPGNVWPELGTRKERIKENVRASEKMQGAVLHQRGASRAAIKEAVARARSAPKIIPFRDPEPASATAGRATVKASGRAPPKTPAKSAFVPFVVAADVEEAKVKPIVPATPRFVPFRDETAEQTAPASSALPAPESVMRSKPLGSGGVGGMSEAEALRKDPFKNYKDV
ncbi:hypothetical protein EW145_g2960 [Phellinidium pouzarii]|uniref:BUB1 N-terminal domain-containing protein n=1 Tax=Phellinidium pouzarii TaxID=167371 RepID=A0A4S4LEE9_9AGAM|nr:hypothetical protein EW145_g2960 [Phellinidium pouzarii]